jgi:O-antigen/teichoic acid export membrane protein
MTRISLRLLFVGTAWTIVAFLVVQVIRVGQSIILARLLSPDIFGTLVILSSLNSGIQLTSDVGIGKGIVYSREAENPDFYNTAWTLQAIRSVILWLIALAIAYPAAHHFELPILVFVIPIAAFSFVIDGFSSVSKALVEKRLLFARQYIFKTATAFTSAGTFVALAYLIPTIWAPVIAGLISDTISMVGSYFLLGDVRQRFHISPSYASQIMQFGKWIFISSFIWFLSSNYDRLYLASTIPLAVLGVYGIARNISELVSSFFALFGHSVIFPFIASHSEVPRTDLRNQLAGMRMKFLLQAAVGLSFFVVIADLVVRLVYDQRYHAASWMLPVLAISSWFSVLSNINEGTLLGLGKPYYNAVSNFTKFLLLLIGLPLGLSKYGFVAAIAVVVGAEMFRYIPLAVGLKRESFSFWRQDFILTLTVFVLIALLNWLRWVLGYGTCFDGLPIDLHLL